MEKEKSIGAFWKKQSANGNEYYSGNIEIDGKKIYLVAFNNTRKQTENQPDIQIYISKKKEGTSKPVEVEKELPTIQEEIDTKDIPF